MKKIYSLFFIALFSVSVFADRATAPTRSDLASFEPDTRVVLCVYFDGPVCGTIVLAGDYRAEGGAWVTDPDRLTKMKPVDGFEGWYAGAVDDPNGKDFKFKPVHLKKDGKFLWDFQCGPKDAWEKAKSDGDDLVISEIGEVAGECGLHYTKPGAYIYYCKYWKDNVSPCEEAKNYTIKVYPPFCEFEIYPTIGGGFDNWENINTEMTYDFDEKGDFYYVNLKDQQPGIAYKIKGGSGWNNPIMMYVDSIAEWRTVNDALNKGKDFRLGDEELIVLDWSDPDHFKYSTCEEIIECDSADYHFTVTFPACVNTKKPAIVSSIDDWGKGTVMTPTGNPNEYIVTLRAECNDKYKFRDEAVAGWGNQLEMFDAESGEWHWMEDTKFGVPEDAEQDVILNFSGENYRWSLCAPTAVREVKATKAIAAKKMLVNGQMMIMVGEAKYSVLGTEVK